MKLMICSLLNPTCANQTIAYFLVITYKPQTVRSEVINLPSRAGWRILWLLSVLRRRRSRTATGSGIYGGRQAGLTRRQTPRPSRPRGSRATSCTTTGFVRHCTLAGPRTRGPRRHSHRTSRQSWGGAHRPHRRGGLHLNLFGARWIHLGLAGLIAGQPEVLQTTHRAPQPSAAGFLLGFLVHGRFRRTAGSGRSGRLNHDGSGATVTGGVCAPLQRYVARHILHPAPVDVFVRVARWDGRPILWGAPGWRPGGAETKQSIPSNTVHNLTLAYFTYEHQRVATKEVGVRKVIFNNVVMELNFKLLGVRWYWGNLYLLQFNTWGLVSNLLTWVLSLTEGKAAPSWPRRRWPSPVEFY